MTYRIKIVDSVAVGHDEVSSDAVFLTTPVGTKPYYAVATLLSSPAGYRAATATLTLDPATIDYAYLSVAQIIQWKYGQLSEVLNTKKSPFAYNDGDSSANYIIAGDLLTWQLLIAAVFRLNGGFSQTKLDGTELNHVFAGLYPRDDGDMEVFTINNTTAARTNLTYAASSPGAGEYTIASRSVDRLLITLGAAGTSGHVLCCKVSPAANDWIDEDVALKSWTEAQFQDYYWGVYGHLKACGDRYYALHGLIAGVTGTDAEKIAKLTDPGDPNYIDLTVGWPATSVN